MTTRAEQTAENLHTARLRLPDWDFGGAWLHYGMVLGSSSELLAREVHGVQPGRFRAKMNLMKTRSNRKRGLYVSYNEKKSGAFDEAVQIPNQSGVLTWLDKSRRKPEVLICPTDIIVRLTGQERYFRGTLVEVKLADKLHPNFALEERTHRPSAWRDRDDRACPQPNKDFKSVFFISTLQEVPQPSEVVNMRPPQGPVYVDL